MQDAGNATSRETPGERHAPKAYFGWKTALDRVAAAVLLVPGLPLIAILVLLIRLTSRGPGVYRQTRVGRDGKQFTMYKLRSMRADAEAQSGPVWAAGGADARVTPLGWWLRKLHLDELPQLFNVLRGEMSLIGPRPERPAFDRVLRRCVAGYAERLQVPPGVTGLAQINLPADTDLNSVRRKIILDGEYIATASFSLDLRIFCCTLLRMLGMKGQTAVQLMRLHRDVELPREFSEQDAALPSGELTPWSISAVADEEHASAPPPTTSDPEETAAALES